MSSKNLLDESSASLLASEPYVLKDNEDGVSVRIWGLDRTIIENALHRGTKLKFPEGVTILFASGSSDKDYDWKRIMRNHDFRVVLANKIMALEDSHEDQTHPVAIAMGKIHTTLTKEWNNLTEEEQDSALEVIKERYLSKILMMSEDRAVYFDPRLRDHRLFMQFKDNPELDILQEIYEPGAPFPGHRLKELIEAMGGVPEFLEALETAYKELPEQDAVKYKDLSREHRTEVTLALKPFPVKNPDEKEIPLPPEGIVIQASTNRNHMEYSKEKLAALLKSDAGLDLDMGAF